MSTFGDVNRAAVSIQTGLEAVGNGLKAIAASLDNIAKAYAQANPPEDRK